MKRRSFLKAPLAAAAATKAFGYPGPEGWVEPENKPDFRRVLQFEHSHSGEILIKSDAAPTPRHLVKPDIINGIWGHGAYEFMRQPLHWHMIDMGWFSGDDLWFPFDGMTEEHEEWLAYYRPACEAHDIICELFGDFRSSIIGSSFMPELGLYCMVHPSSPRYVTAKLYGVEWIPTFKQAVEARSKNIIVRQTRLDPFPVV